MANEFKIKKGLIVTGASGGTVVDIQGSQGQLFSVTDDLSGTIFAVSDISGVPIFDVNSSGLSTFDGALAGTSATFSGDITLGDDLNFTTNGFADISNTGTGAMRFKPSSQTLALTLTGANAAFAGGISLSGNISASTGDLALLSSSGEFILYGATDGQTNIYYNGLKKFETSSIGVEITGKGTSSATITSDGSSTLTTKGYVDGLITGATIYRGTWDPDVSLNSGYGNPNLSTVTQTSGYYYICSDIGTAHPNGTTGSPAVPCEPNSWEVGDWVIWNDDVPDCAGTGTGAWQKIDNTSVLSGIGTGQTVALWEGASSVTDSETLGNAPITVSGNNTTFAGTITSGNITINGSSRALVVRSSNDQVVSSFTCDGNAISTIGFKGNTGANDYNVRIGADGSSLVAYTVNTVRMTINSSGNTTFTGDVTAGNDIKIEGNELTFKSAGAAFIDHNTVGNSIKFRLSSSSSLDVIPLEITPSYVAFLDVPIVGTMTAGNNTTRAASTAFVTSAVATGVGSYLPLSAGSGYPLTGDLYINKSAPVLRLNDTNNNVPYELRVDGTTFSIKEVTNSRTLMSMTAGAVITLDSLASNTVINTTGAMVVPNGNVGIGVTGPASKLTIDAPAGNFANGANAISLNYDGGSSPGDVGGGIVFSQKWWSASAGQQVTGGIYGIKNAGNGTFGGGLVFYTQPNSAANMAQRMIIDTDGDVGIGTTSANTGKLVVEGAAYSISSSGQSLGGIDLRTAANGGAGSYSAGISFGGGSSGRAAISGVMSPASTDGDRQGLAFFTHGSGTGAADSFEAMRIQSDGNVGIGTDDPSRKVQIDGGSSDSAIQFTNTVTGSTASDGTYIGHAGTGTDFQIWNYETGYIRFGTTGSEAMRINSSRDVIMGNTVVNPSSNFSTQKGFGYKFSTGQTEIAATSDVPTLTLGRNLSNDGSILDLRKEGTVIGQFGSNTTGGQSLLDISANVTNGNMRFLTAGSERMRITSGGKVIVGTDSSNALEIFSSGDTEIGFSYATKGNVYSKIIGDVTVASPLAGELAFQTASGGTLAERMRISSAGAIKFNAYDSTNQTGTPTYMLGTDTSGNVVKVLGGNIPGGGGTVTGTGVATRVAFWSGTSSLSADSNLYWDDTNNRLGIGITGPAAKLHVMDYGTNLGITTDTGILIGGTGSSGQISQIGFGYTENTRIPAAIGAIVTSAAAATKSDLIFATRNSTVNTVAPTERMRIDSAGNVGIGTDSPDAILETSKEVAGNQVGALLTNTRQAGTADSVSINFGLGRTADGYIRSVDAIKLLKEQQWTGTPSTVDAALVFSTVQNEAVSERARITSTGHLQVSTGYFELTSQPTTKLWLTTNQVQLYAGGLLVFAGYNSSNDAVVVGNETGDINITLAGGSNNKVLYLEGSSGNVGIGTKTPLAKLDIQGTQGQLFSVTDNLSGSIFAVADISGVPIFDVNSNGTSYFDGNVGIGTDSPQQKLHIKSTASGPTGIIIENTNNSQSLDLDFWSNGGSAQGRIRYEEGPGAFAISPNVGTPNAMYINYSNNVGIGTTGPAVPLDVEGKIRSTDGAAGDFVEVWNDGSQSGWSYITTSANELVLVPQSGGLILQGENSGVGNNASLQIYNALNTAVNVKLDSSGDSYLNGGDVGIGDTSPSNKLDVNGDVRATQYKLRGNATNPTNTAVAIYDQATVGLTLSAHSVELRGWTGSAMARSAFITYNTATFAGTCTATNFILSSDKALKDNIKEIDTKHVDVEWKNFELTSEPGIKRSGVIAQELEEKHPEFVRTDKDGLKSVAYIDLLITKIAELEARLEKAGL